MASVFTVAELLALGASQNDFEVCVKGCVWDRFEHFAIYDSLTTTAEPEPTVGIWLAGQLANRRPRRDDGPLHRQSVRLIGKFHWQPKRGAGHFSLWPAWLGVRAVEVLSDTNLESTMPRHDT